MYKNLKEFCTNKDPGDLVFDKWNVISFIIPFLVEGVT